MDYDTALDLVIVEAQLLLMTLTLALLYSCVPVSPDSGTVSQHAEYHDHQTEAAE